MSELLLAYYADDFTGSTDALECLAAAGVPAMLFVDPPTLEQVSAYPGVQAIGVAGSSRSMPTDDLEVELRTAFPKLREFGTRHVYYKVCSTFDSSPTIGSIGRAIDIGAEVFKPSFVPMLIGAPDLGRYCVFGNLYARMGIGSDGAIHRLDQHPATRNHPITPATESDLRLYLGEQTDREVRLFDVLMHELPDDAAMHVLSKLADDKSVVLFDVLYSRQLKRIGKLIDSAADEGTMFSVGSSAFATALAEHWHATGVVSTPEPWPHAAEAERLLVLSGSCSPVTEAQTDWAIAHGFHEVALDSAKLVNPDMRRDCLEIAVGATEQLLSKNHSVIVHTGRGVDDERIAKTRSVVAETVSNADDVISETTRRLAAALGDIGRKSIAAGKISRVCVAGGDTSSFVARTLGIEALEMIAPISPGAPLCRARSSGPANGIEFNFKGGQVGEVAYFESVRRGKLS